MHLHTMKVIRFKVLIPPYIKSQGRLAKQTLKNVQVDESGKQLPSHVHELPTIFAACVHLTFMQRALLCQDVYI